MLTRRAFSFSDAITLTSKRCQHGILVVHLTVLLSLFPTLLAWLAWRAHPNLAPPAFRDSAAAIVLRPFSQCTLCHYLCFGVACHLYCCGKRGVRIGAALLLVLASGLAFFARGIARLLLLGSALLLVIVVYGGIPGSYWACCLTPLQSLFLSFHHVRQNVIDKRQMTLPF